MSAVPRTFPGRLTLIVVAALAVRVAYALAIAHRVEVTGDAFAFHWTANLLAQGHGFIRAFDYIFSGRQIATAEHPPLYELYLAAFSKLGADGYGAHRMASCLLGALTVGGVGLLARRVADERTGLVAAGIAAVYPLLWVIDGSLMSESLYVLVITVVLLAGYRFADLPSLARAAVLGIAIAVAALTRGEALLLLVLLVLPLAVRAAPAWGRRIALLAVAGAAFVVVIAPWSVRNWIVFDRPVAISNNSGTLLSGANCSATYRGRDIGMWRTTCFPPHVGGNEAQQAAVFRRVGIDYASDHAGRVPLVALARVGRTWDVFQPQEQAYDEAFEGRNIQVERIGTGFYYVLLVLAIAGVALLRRRGGQLLILLSPVVLVTTMSIVGYGITRFRAAAEPIIVVLATVALVTLADRVRERRA